MIDVIQHLFGTCGDGHPALLPLVIGPVVGFAVAGWRRIRKVLRRASAAR